MNKVLYFSLYLLLCFYSLPSLSKQKVLIIESYHTEYEWDKSYIEGINSVFKDDYNLIYFQMDCKRLGKSAHQKRADLAWNYYLETQPDLVILGDDIALDYLGTRFDKTSTPTIYLGINNNPRHYNIHYSDNISGVLERPLIKRSIPLITQLLPNKTQRVLVLLDNSATSYSILKEIFSNQTQIIISSISVDIKLIGSWDIWKKTIIDTENRNYDALFIGTYHTITDKNGIHVPEDTVINWSSNHTSIPPFAFWKFAVGENKAIGGLVLFGYEQGKIAAEMAKEILDNGTKPSQLMPRTAQKGQYIFSIQELNKYGLHLSDKIAKKAFLIN